MKKENILSVDQIREIKDLNKLNAVIKEYERELNRRMRILQRYKESDSALYQKGMKTFADVGKTAGFYNVKISSPESQNIIVARARLQTLAGALRSGNTQIRSLRKNAKLALKKQQRGVYESLNYGKKRVTLKQVSELSASDWAEIRGMLSEYPTIDSDTVIQTYISNQNKLDEIADRYFGQDKKTHKATYDYLKRQAAKRQSEIGTFTELDSEAW